MRSKWYNYSMEDIAMICGISRALVYSDRDRGKFDPMDLRSVVVYMCWRMLAVEINKQKEGDVEDDSF